jgi:hypothetical protein
MRAKYGGGGAEDSYNHSEVDCFGRMHQQQQSSTSRDEHHNRRTAWINRGMQ